MLALNRVSFRVPQGATVALVGESGSGKSITAQAIMRILPRSASITSGRVVFTPPDGRERPVDLVRLAPDGRRVRRIRGRHISMIFQEPMVSLSPLHTIGDQVSEALFLHHRIGHRAGMARTEDMLRRVGFPDPKRALRTYPFQLSGGLRQRAMIAMALVCRPSLLIADEPTTALDVTIQAQILALVRELQAELGMAVLIITHDLGVVANVAEHVVVLYQGRVMEQGPVDAIFTHPGHPYLRALLRAVPHFDMKPGERLVSVRSVDSQSGPMVQMREPWPPDAGDAHLIVEGIVKTFAQRSSGFLVRRAGPVFRAVDDVSLAIRRGQCFGLVGESGCGKTTLSKVIMRAMDADAGSVRYNDRGRIIDVGKASGETLMHFRRRVQYIFQDPFGSLSPRMTVFDILREPLIIHQIGDADYRAEMAKELMRLVGLDPRYLSRYPHSFSGGQRQRIGIARALALAPDLILCDEPVSALDVSIQAQILNLLKDLQKELGLTYLFISHNLAVVDYVADDIAVMCRGRIVEIAPREALFRNPIHPYTLGLLAAVPYPDLDRKLDLVAVQAGAARSPREWPAPFAWTDTSAGELVDVGDGHRVRMQPREVEVAA
ncbi:MAG TPA: ABC transporter ATP-binding protein [Casimicrobiaceae bacterium]|nr:ABC transporter ATP-binding protein [Casimicrobiaceae bacterium]